MDMLLMSSLILAIVANVLVQVTLDQISIFQYYILGMHALFSLYYLAVLSILHCLFSEGYC